MERNASEATALVRASRAESKVIPDTFVSRSVFSG
jgi:hypothetical protein